MRKEREVSNRLDGAIEAMNIAVTVAGSEAVEICWRNLLAALQSHNSAMLQCPGGDHCANFKNVCKTCVRNPFYGDALQQ